MMAQYFTFSDLRFALIQHLRVAHKKLLVCRKKERKNETARELLTSGKCRVQYVSLRIITSSLREVIPKIQNIFNYSCIVDCQEIFQSLIF